MVNDVFLYPVEGTFDVAQIEAYLAQKPDVEPDPLGTGAFMVCGVPEAKELCREERLADPSRFPYVVLVTVKPEEVNVFQQYGDDYRLRSAREIVRWVLDHYKVRIEDDLMKDWTERVAKEGVDVLYPKTIG